MGPSFRTLFAPRQSFRLRLCFGRPPFFFSPRRSPPPLKLALCSIFGRVPSFSEGSETQKTDQTRDYGRSVPGSPRGAFDEKVEGSIFFLWKKSQVLSLSYGDVVFPLDPRRQLVGPLYLSIAQKCASWGEGLVATSGSICLGRTLRGLFNRKRVKILV